MRPDEIASGVGFGPQAVVWRPPVKLIPRMKHNKRVPAQIYGASGIDRIGGQPVTGSSLIALINEHIVAVWGVQ